MGLLACVCADFGSMDVNSFDFQQFSVKMLAILSRDPHNAKRVVQLQQDAQASLVAKKGKKCLSEEKKEKTQPTLVFPSVSTEQKHKTNLDVQGTFSASTETTFPRFFESYTLCK